MGRGRWGGGGGGGVSGDGGPGHTSLGLSVKGAAGRGGGVERVGGGSIGGLE